MVYTYSTIGFLPLHAYTFYIWEKKFCLLFMQLAGEVQLHELELDSMHYCSEECHY